MKGRPPPGPSERTGSPTRLAQSVRRCGRARGAAALAPWRAARIPGARTAARARPPPAAHSAPCRPLRARPSSGRRARAAALAAPRWLHRAHPRAARGLRGVNPEVHGPAGRGAGVRASGRAAGGGLRRSLPHGDSTRDLSQPPRRAAPPSPRSRLRAGLRSTLLTCWTRTRTPPTLHPAPLTSTASWSRHPGACHFQREPGLRARGIPGLGVRAAWARAARPEPCVRRRLAHTCPPPLPAASLAARAQRARLNLPFIPWPGVRAPPPRDSARRVPRRGHAPAPPQPPPPSQARPRGLWARTGRTAPLSSGRLWAWACGLFSSRLSRAPWVALSTSDGDSPRWFPQPRAQCGELRGGLAIGERLGRRRGMLGTHRIKKVRVTPPSRRTWRPLCLIRCVLDPKFRRLTDDQIRSRKVRGQIRGCACGPGVACHVSPDNFVVFSCHSILARMVSRLQSSCEFTVGGNWLIKSDSVFQQIKQGLFRTKSTGFVSKLKL